ncbi:hypothetical protein BT96DRAFT_759387, partial [Gymnopus androsaceus JB14]
QMGHISPSAAKRMVNGKFVEGVLLDRVEKPQCQMCIFTKLARKPVPKQRQGEVSTKVGEQIHSDVW